MENKLEHHIYPYFGTKFSLPKKVSIIEEKTLIVGMTKSYLSLANQSLESNLDQQDNPVNTQELALLIAEAGDDRKAENIVILNLSNLSYIADYFVIMTGFSQPQLRAISLSIEDKVAEKFKIEPLRVEGKNEGNWILHDYGDVIAHVFLPSAREFYGLEAFWGGAEKIDFQSQK
jgi:ribosome-associated protein